MEKVYVLHQIGSRMKIAMHMIHVHNFDMYPFPRYPLCRYLSFRGGASNFSARGLKWFSGYCKCQKSPENRFSPSDGGL